MTERQYLLQHILHLSAKLSNTTNPRQKQNLEEALLFYAKELKSLDEQQKQTYIQ